MTGRPHGGAPPRPRRGPAIVLAVLLAASGVVTRDARADESAPGNAELREAETRFKEGLTLYAQGSINEARVKLVQAYAVLGRTNILWNLAVAEYFSSRFLDAVRHMRQFVRAPDADPKDVAVAKQQFLPQLEKQTGRITIRAPRGSTLAVDGDELGPAPIDDAVDVVPGRHLVLARTPGGNATTNVTVRAGQVVPVTLEADPPAADPGRAAAPTAAADAAPSTAKTITVVGLAAGAVIAAGVGAGFLLSSSSRDDDATALSGKIGPDPAACSGSANPDCARLADANDARDRDRALGAGFLVGGGALAVGAGLAVLLWPSAARSSPSSRRGPAMAALPLQGGAFGAVRVRF